MQNMQHDIRTPASGVAAMLEIIAKKESDVEKKKILDQIADSSRKLLNILNAIFEFDSIEYGTFPVLSEQFSLEDVIHDVVALEAPTAELKHIKLKTHLDAKLPVTLVGDPFRMQRVLINLLSNAIKFTSTGYVEIDEVLWKQIDKENVLIQLIVKDTGIGIPKDKQKVIFERFSRLDPSNRGVYSGLGLGLSMVKQFVEEMKGSIEVKSEPNKGTTFICTIPFKLSPLRTKEQKTKQRRNIKWTEKTNQANLALEQKQQKILLVEDDSMAQLVAKTLFDESFDCLLDIASTGQEAVEFVKNADPLYNLIFMDIGLPDGSGCDFSQDIHALSQGSSKIPIIALTAHDDDDTRKLSQVCGMQDYVTKPISPEKINAVFKEWLGKSNKAGKQIKKTLLESTKIIDFELGAKLISGTTEKAKEMLKMLVDSLPESQRLMEKSYKSNDFEELRKAAHKLHSSTCYCGTPKLKEASKALEDAIRNQSDGIESLYQTLLTEITNVQKAFEKL